MSKLEEVDSWNMGLSTVSIFRIEKSKNKRAAFALEGTIR
jgi:hypothetical protein